MQQAAVHELEGVAFGLAIFQAVHRGDVEVAVAQAPDQVLGKIVLHRVLVVGLGFVAPHAGGFHPVVVRRGRLARGVADARAVEQRHGRVVAGAEEFGLVVADDQQHIQAGGGDGVADAVHRGLGGVVAFAQPFGRRQFRCAGRGGGQQRGVVGRLAGGVEVVRVLGVDDTEAVHPVLALRDQHDAVR